MSMDNKIYYYLDQVEKLIQGEFVPPVTCEIDPSNKCMLDCNFCMFENYRDCSREDLPWEIYQNLIHDLKNLGTRSITFTGGGEPLMHPQFNQMIGAALTLGFQVGLVTNGVKLDRIENPNDFLFIRISLDAHNAKDYKAVKGVDLFDRVINNIKAAVASGSTVGLSYVVGPDNNKNLEKAEKLAEELGVSYIQIKPAYMNDKREIFTDFEYPDGRPIIGTKRYIPKDTMPCTIAALVGIVGADSNVYYCCQHRGVDKFKLGSLIDNSFSDLWKKRLAMKPNITFCPMCRYMNYTKAYKEILENGDLFFQHRYFL